MEHIKAIVNASYTFNDVVWYCWLTALFVTLVCLAWIEFTKDLDDTPVPSNEFESARRKMMKGGE